MNLDYNIRLDQKQEIVLTPELKMAIEILQYSSQELSEFIDKEIQENPLLEKLSDSLYKDNYSNISPKKKRIEYEKFISYKPSFYEELENQLFEVLNKEEIKIGKFLVGSFNEKGELTVGMEVIAETFSIDKNKIKEILTKVKLLDIDFSKINSL